MKGWMHKSPAARPQRGHMCVTAGLDLRSVRLKHALVPKGDAQQPEIPTPLSYALPCATPLGSDVCV